MEYKNYIRKILDSNNSEKIDELGDYLGYIIDMVGDREKEKVEEKLYEIAEGKILNEEIAGEIIRGMKPVGMKWKLEDTEAVRNNYGLSDIRPVDFWIVMNSAANDFKDLFGDNLEWYVKYSKAFIKDEDAIDDKVYCYFMKMVKKV